MRVLVVVQGGAGAKVAGPEIRGWALARALAEHHDVTVAVEKPSASSREGLRLIRNRRSELVGEARRHDAVVAPVLPPYLLLALRASGTVTVSDQYDPVWLELALLADQPGMSRVLRAQLMIRDAQVRFADVIVVAGERQRQLLLDELGGLGHSTGPAVVNVPFGVPAEPERSAARPLRAAFPEIGPDDPLILWWGKVWKWFDASTAIRAFAHVVERRPNARLVITAGKAPKAKFDLFDESEQARELSRSLGLLGQNVFFLDEWTPYDRRHAYLQDADIGLTLHANTAEAPFAARARYMDYIWAGLPCVLARGDEIAASFGAAGFATLVDPADADATAQAILGLIDDPRSRAAARSAGLALAESYRWPNAVRPLAAAIEAVHGRRTARSSSGLLSTAGRYYGRRTVDHALGFARSAAPFRGVAAAGDPRLI
jgi:glycosyltransferase involved in cell wall biosynthesis